MPRVCLAATKRSFPIRSHLGHSAVYLLSTARGNYPLVEIPHANKYEKSIQPGHGHPGQRGMVTSTRHCGIIKCCLLFLIL